MSQQGIFSIAPEGQNGSSPANGASPFSVAVETPSDSPFAAVSDGVSHQASADDRAGIPARRPVGQPPALGGAASSEQPEQQAPTAIFTPVQEAAPAPSPAGGAFEMNGFPSNGSDRAMEAAPVAPAPEPSPFVAAGNGRQDYENARAALEPQQDFAAVSHPAAVSPFAPVAPAEPQQAAETAPFVQAVASQPMAQTQVQPAAPVAAPVAAPAPQPAPQEVPLAAPSPSFQQLELRAIFGVDHLLDQQEILQRARTLPGVRNVAVVGSTEASALSNFRQAMQSMGFGDSNAMKLSSGGGSVDFIAEAETTVAILHEGNYAPGVKETLIIVAREIGKLA